MLIRRMEAVELGWEEVRADLRRLLRGRYRFLPMAGRHEIHPKDKQAANRELPENSSWIQGVREEGEPGRISHLKFVADRKGWRAGDVLRAAPAGVRAVANLVAIGMWVFTAGTYLRDRCRRPRL